MPSDTSQSIDMSGFTMAMLTQQAVSSIYDENNPLFRDAIWTYRARAIDTAAKLGLCAYDVTSDAAGRALLAWLSANCGLSYQQACDLSVDEAIRLATRHRKNPTIEPIKTTVSKDLDVVLREFLIDVGPSLDHLPDPFDYTAGPLSHALPARLRGKLAQLQETESDITDRFTRQRGRVAQSSISSRSTNTTRLDSQLRDIDRKEEKERSEARERWITALSQHERDAFDAYCLVKAQAVLVPLIPAAIPTRVHGALARLAFEAARISKSYNARRAALRDSLRARDLTNPTISSSLLQGIVNDQQEAKQALIGRWLRELSQEQEGALQHATLTEEETVPLPATSEESRDFPGYEPSWNCERLGEFLVSYYIDGQHQGDDVADMTAPWRGQDEFEECVCLAVTKLTTLTRQDWQQLNLPAQRKVWLLEAIGEAFRRNANTAATEGNFGSNVSVAEERAVAYIERLRGKPLKDPTRVDLTGYNQLDDAGLQVISALGLKELNLKGCDKITDDGLAHLIPRRLEILKLDRCLKIGDDGLRHIGRITSLRELHIQITKITGVGLVHLKDLIQLQVLVINKDDYQTRGVIEDRDLEHLRPLVNLEYLDVKGTKVTIAGIMKLKESLPKLSRVRPAMGKEIEFSELLIGEGRSFEGPLAALTPEDEQILGALNQAFPTTLTQEDIAERTRLGVRTVRKRLKILREGKLVKRPLGERSGELITDFGRKHLKLVTNPAR